METDRLFHFFWSDLESKRGSYDDFRIFLRRLDGYIGRLKQSLGRARLLFLSDHGFCAARQEVQINLWLESLGWLKFESGQEKKLENYAAGSLCYSLVPGRLFINLTGREEKGSVDRASYNRVREEIKQALLSLTDPVSGEKVVARVFFREEIYHGPYLENAADIIAQPVNGYDLKGRLETREIFAVPEIGGMHTYDDAFICGTDIDLSSINCIQDGYNLILSGY
jgi:predicted AlkP superfamily phosphohydrolase/phosphomutase